ncbi:MAG: hypothetical protein J6T62_03730 [Fibrobacter sp.]|nr:hypothetical protein [Fibrobacter sp.]
MTIPELATMINENLTGYKMLSFQSLRMKMKGLEQPRTYKIFSKTTTNDEWAFHDGGRSEIQYNIGLDEGGIRYGLAFSLEPSQTLPNPSILYYKVHQLNYLIEEKPELFDGLSLWSWYNRKRTNYPDMCIPQRVITNKSFIFLGKECLPESVDVNEILQTFDRMLEIYVRIEGGIDENPLEQNDNPLGFSFNPSVYRLPHEYSFGTTERRVLVKANHSKIQAKLIEELKREFGDENVSVEQKIGYNEIDVAVKDGNEYIFYEVKVASSLKMAIREALGQLMEYSYYRATKLAKKLVIVSDYELDERNEAYLTFLRREFNLPFEYKKIIY